MALVGMAVRYMGRSQERTDAVLIGQEVMEILKTNRRFHMGLPISEEMDRNGRVYRIEVMRTMEMMEGLPLEKASVTVWSPNESVTFQHVLGRRGGPYGE